MSDAYESDITVLLRQCRIGFLATTGKNGPETSMAPYAIHHGNILLHLSRLAKHTGNIETDSSIGLMICTPETEGNTPLALPRLSLQGNALPVSDKQLAASRDTYLKVIPDAESLFSFADFQLFEVKLSHIHWVGGFGKAGNLSLEQWQIISHASQRSFT